MKRSIHYLEEFAGEQRNDNLSQFVEMESFGLPQFYQLTLYSNVIPTSKEQGEIMLSTIFRELFVNGQRTRVYCRNCLVWTRTPSSKLLMKVSLVFTVQTDADWPCRHGITYSRLGFWYKTLDCQQYSSSSIQQWTSSSSSHSAFSQSLRYDRTLHIEIYWNANQ